jgi:hypothetical protein
MCQVSFAENNWKRINSNRKTRERINSMTSFLFSKHHEMFMTEICGWKLMRIIYDVQSVKALIRLLQCFSKCDSNKLKGRGSWISGVFVREENSRPNYSLFCVNIILRPLPPCQTVIPPSNNSVTCQRVAGLCGGGTRVCNPPLSARLVNETSAQARWRHTSGVRECHVCLRGCQETSRYTVRLQREWETWRNSTVERPVRPVLGYR